MAEQAAVTVYTKFQRIPSDVIRQLTGFPTGYFADIQGRRGALDATIKPVFASGPVIGTAVTVKSVPDDNLAAYAALGVLKAGDVLVIATGGWTGSAVIGDLIVGFFKNAGIAAVVTDGAVRDVDGLEALGVPVFARGVTPNSPQKNGPGEIGGEVAIGGAVVRSGDLVVGDRDGIVVLPQGRLDGALEAVQAVKAKEAAIEESIAAGVICPRWLEEFLAGDDVRYRD